MIHLKFFLDDFFFSLFISLLKRKDTCKNTSTDRVQQYFLAFEDEVALGPEMFHVRFPFSEVFCILNSFMLFALCEIYHASAVVYIQKNLYALFWSRFPTFNICLVYWQHFSLSNANFLRHFCPFIIGDIWKNNSLTSGHLRSPRDDFIQILITTSSKLQ